MISVSPSRFYCLSVSSSIKIFISDISLRVWLFSSSWYQLKLKSFTIFIRNWWIFSLEFVLAFITLQLGRKSIKAKFGFDEHGGAANFAFISKYAFSCWWFFNFILTIKSMADSLEVRLTTIGTFLGRIGCNIHVLLLERIDLIYILIHQQNFIFQ